jgi:hypothetical protein
MRCSATADRTVNYAEMARDSAATVTGRGVQPRATPPPPTCRRPNAGHWAGCRSCRSAGMVGGQAIDLRRGAESPRAHARSTVFVRCTPERRGALRCGSAGAFWLGTDQLSWPRSLRCGPWPGVSIVDGILDVEGDAATPGRLREGRCRRQARISSALQRASGPRRLHRPVSCHTPERLHRRLALADRRVGGRRRR